MGDSTSDFNKVAFLQTNDLSSDNLPLMPTRSSAMVFRTALQEEPIYWLIAEINPPDFTNEFSSENHTYLLGHPWYLASNSNSNSRLSGWKESNSLYSGRRTFH